MSAESPFPPALGPRSWTALHRRWFGTIAPTQDYIEGRRPLWSQADLDASAALRRAFLPWLRNIDDSMVGAWRASPRGFLTLILLFPQLVLWLPAVMSGN